MGYMMFMNRLQRIYIIVTVICASLSVAGASAQNYLGNYISGKVVHSSIHKNRHRDGENYTLFNLRIRLSDAHNSRIVTAKGLALKGSDFEDNLFKIINNTRFGTFVLSSQGIGYVIVSAWPGSGFSNFDKEYPSDFFPGDGTSCFPFRALSSEKLENAISIGNSTIRIGN